MVTKTDTHRKRAKESGCLVLQLYEQLMSHRSKMKPTDTILTIQQMANQIPYSPYSIYIHIILVTERYLYIYLVF